MAITVPVGISTRTFAERQSSRRCRVWLMPAEVKLRSSFTDAGINQTLHRLLLELSAELRVLIPAGTVTARVYTDVTLAETLIVGRVPDSYMYFESSDRWDDPLEQYDILN